MKGCLNWRMYCEPFHRNPSQSIAIHITIHHNYITIHHNTSQSIAIFCSTFAAAGSPVSGLVSQVGYQDGHHRIVIIFERSHEHKCSNRNRGSRRVPNWQHGAKAALECALESWGWRCAANALQTDTGQTASGKLSVREARAAEVGCMGDREQSVRQTAFAGS